MVPLKRFCVGSAEYGLNISADNYVETGLRFLRTSDIEDGGNLSTDNGVFVDPTEELGGRHLLQNGDLLFSRSGTLGRCLRYHDSIGPATFAGYLVRFRPNPGTDSRYIEYCAQTAFFQAAIEADAVTSTISNFNAEKYAMVRCPDWSHKEQRAIADYLDVETARIDALIAKKQQLIHLLEERSRSLVDSLFEPKQATAVTRLGRLAEVRSGVTLNESRAKGASDVTLPYLRVANVQPGFLNLSDVKQVTVTQETATRCSLAAGDVLMTEGGDIDKLGRGTVWSGEISPCLHQNHVFAVRPATKLKAKYLALLTRTSHARSYFESTGVKSTNLASTNSSKVADFPVPVLSLEEQTSRIDKYRLSEAPLEESILVTTRQIKLLKEKRQALITAAVTGEFTVPGAA